MRISLDKKPARFALAARKGAGETRTTDWIPAIAGMTAWAGMTGSESHRLATLGHTLWSSAPPPPKEVGHPAELMTTVFALLILMLLASSLMYFAERDAQPDAFSSIPAAMWWAVATLSTVGYGDVYPVTVGGKLLAAVIAILGIGMFALPTGILGSGFVEEVQRKRTGPQRCPHCGHSLSNKDD